MTYLQRMAIYTMFTFVAHVHLMIWIQSGHQSDMCSQKRATSQDIACK